ncbi:MAG: hypothetical protein AAGF12_43010 [Myxococcota bacterium]
MKFVGSLLIFLTCFATAATAQSTPAESGADGSIVQSPPGYPPSTPPPARSADTSYEQYRLNQLRTGVKRTRTALIATSASLAVGIALVVPAFTSDNCVENDFNDNINCTTAGKALLGVGLPFLSVGFWGAIVSGIMLGVRKGKVRRLEEQIAYRSRAKLRWDPERGSFVF